MSEIQASTCPDHVLYGRLADVRLRIGEERWARRQRVAQHKAKFLGELHTLRDSDSSVPLSQAIGAIDKDLSPVTVSYWLEKIEGVPMELWEGVLVDARLPPEPVKIPDVVRQGAVLLRRANPLINCDTTRQILYRQFGDVGKISDTSLKRIWAEAGVSLSPGGARPFKEQRLPGGFGIALLGVAAEETGAPRYMAEAVKSAIPGILADEPVDRPVVVDRAGRDDLGCFTAQYNHQQTALKNDDGLDPRRLSDATKRVAKSQRRRSLVRESVDTIRDKLFTLGSISLLTALDGMDGLDSPTGELLCAAGMNDYKAATLDKFVADLSMLDMEETLWHAHAIQWAKVTKKWMVTPGDSDASDWKQAAIYIDNTKNPYWTTAYAPSGKIAGMNKVMPCVSRICISAGPAAPLLVQTFTGHYSIATHLFDILNHAKQALGGEDIGRLTIVDAEMASMDNFRAFKHDPDRSFITVLKAPFKNATLNWTSAWQPGPKGAGHVREGTATFCEKGKPDLMLRCVQFCRRTPSEHGGTHYITDAFVDQDAKIHLTTLDVVEAHLSRWNNQERQFRNGRNGGGFERTIGYGGSFKHVSLVDKAKKLNNRLRLAEARLEKQSSAVAALEKLKSESTTEQGELEREAASVAANATTKLKKIETRTIEKTRNAIERLSQQGDTRRMFHRDMTRDGIATAATMMVMMLVEFVLREYTGLTMELRTFIEYLVRTPITVRTEPMRLVYTVEDKGRHPKVSVAIRRACEEVTSRRVKRGSRVLVFQVTEP